MARSDPTEQMDRVWVRGVDSFNDPRLGDGYVQRAWNSLFRAGAIRTRPGTQHVHTLPDGRLQGFTHYEPRRGPAQLVAVVDGVVWVSRFPFRTWENVGSLMYRFAPRMHFCRAEQSVRRNADDSLTMLGAPLPLLIIQDGVSPPLVWNGYQAERQIGVDLVPQGTCMVWSGHRLWVARDNWVFASDFANPLSFVERYYLGGLDSLLAPGRVTAMAEVEGTGDPHLLVFTDSKTIAVKSNILTRELWIETPGFARTLFPNVGCTSPRSVVSHLGQLWWWTAQGLTSFNLAAATNVTSLFPLADHAMTASKAHVSDTDGQVAGIGYGNLLLMSVPYGGTQNRHTWVFDESVVTDDSGRGAAAWSGVWQGFNPVEWTRFVVDGSERVYCAATDGTRNQILELSHRFSTDSGKDIEAGAELRVVVHGATVPRIVRYGELAFSELAGDVDLRVDWRGLSRGRYKPSLVGRFVASRGTFAPGPTVGQDHAIYATRGQTRRVRTTDMSYSAPDAAVGCVESKLSEDRDFGFNLLVRWSGVASLREVRMYVSPEAESNAGGCPATETDPHFVRFDGATSSSADFAEGPDAGRVFTATESVSTTVNGVSAIATRTASSAISEPAAVKAASQSASAQVAYTLRKAPFRAYGVIP